MPDPMVYDIKPIHIRYGTESQPLRPQGDLPTPHLGKLAKTQPYLPESDWYKYYINPFTLLNRNPEEFTFFHVGLSGCGMFLFAEEAFKRAKDNLLHEIELGDGKISWLSGPRIGKTDAISHLSRLGTSRSGGLYGYHETESWEVESDIFRDIALNEFLMRGDLKYFLTDDRGMESRKSVRLIKHVGTQFAAQFDHVLSRALEQADIAVVGCLMGRRWCVDSAQPSPRFEESTRVMTRLCEPIKQLAMNTCARTPKLTEVSSALKHKNVGELLALCSVGFDDCRRSFGSALVVLGTRLLKSSDATYAMDVITLGGSYKNASPDLTKRLAETKKRIDAIDGDGDQATLLLRDGGTAKQSPAGALSDSVRRIAASALCRSPFAVLNVTAHDNRRRIVELAEEKSLEIDEGVCQKARADLTNPRTRLTAEIAWLPGVSPSRASQLVGRLVTAPMGIREEAGLPTLAHLNLLAAAFEAVDSEHGADDLAAFITEAADLAEELKPEEVLRDINEDRAVSGFPKLHALDPIKAELAERKLYYRGAIRNALDRLSPLVLIKVITQTVEHVTSGGERQAPELIDELVDRYEVETQDVLQKEAENVRKLIKATRAYVDSGGTAVKPYLSKLEAVVRNWDKIAQPIQLSAKARGIDHEASRKLAYEIRSLAIDLFEKHDMLVHSQRLTRLIQEVFSEVPEIAERVKKDADELADIFQQRKETIQERKQAALRRDEWEREITYRAEIGRIFKQTLSISPQGISWKGQNFPLDSITRVRWGGISHSDNGVRTETIYTIAFGNRNSEAVVELKKQDIYLTFTDKLWRSVGLRLLTELLEALKDGSDLRCGGEALLHDDGITLVKLNLHEPDEKVRYPWSRVHVWSADGSFWIGAKDNKNVNVEISYIRGANTHVLEQAIRMAFKKPGMHRLSDLLQ